LRAWLPGWYGVADGAAGAAAAAGDGCTRPATAARAPASPTPKETHPCEVVPLTTAAAAWPAGLVKSVRRMRSPGQDARGGTRAGRRRGAWRAPGLAPL